MVIIRLSRCSELLCFRYLSVENDNKKEIAKAGGIAPLVALLCAPSGPTLTQEAAAKALWNLAVEDGNKVRV